MVSKLRSTEGPTISPELQEERGRGVRREELYRARFGQFNIEMPDLVF